MPVPHRGHTATSAHVSHGTHAVVGPGEAGFKARLMAETSHRSHFSAVASARGASTMDSSVFAMKSFALAMQRCALAMDIVEILRVRRRLA